jgi:hypothetical protein
MISTLLLCVNFAALRETCFRFKIEPANRWNKAHQGVV